MDTRSELSTATAHPTLSPVTDPMTVAWAPKRTADGAIRRPAGQNAGA
jgi:hypothetical protein